MEYHYRYNDHDYIVRLEPRPDGSYVAYLGERAIPVSVQRAQEGQLNLIVGGQRVHAYTAAAKSPQTATQLRYVALVDQDSCFFEVIRTTGEAQHASAGRAGSGGLAAQMPGQVMQVLVVEGDAVEEGQPLMILEAMKMEIRVSAPVSGRVTRLFVAQGDTVERGQQLAEVSPA